MYAFKILTLLTALFTTSLAGYALDLPLRATPDKVDQKLKELDGVLEKRSVYLASRVQSLDSISSIIGPEPADSARAFLAMGKSMASYSVDQAIDHLKNGMEIARNNSLDGLHTECALAIASTYPSNGYIAEALRTFNAIDPEQIPKNLYAKYYCSGEKMYETILDFYSNTNADTKFYEEQRSKFRQNAMKYFAPESPEWLLREIKQYIDGGRLRAAQVALYDIIHDLDDTHPVYTEATRLMSKCAETTGLEHDRIYYLAASAISEIKRGDREGVALHLTGQQLFSYGDIDRAHSYLSKAIESIPEAGTQSPRNEALIKTLMTIDDSYQAKMNNNILLLSILIATLVLWVVIISISLRNHKKTVSQLSRERHLVIEANNAKETFLHKFLELGIVSTQRLVSYRKLITRKIGTKQYADLFEISKSTKVIDEQRKQFMTIFDASLLSIYPTFVEELNRLMRPDEQYTLADNHLPSELRVVALLRLGIDDVGQIAEVMSLSVSSVYAYRAKVRNKAVNKETFDSDLMNIGTASPFSDIP